MRGYQKAPLIPDFDLGGGTAPTISAEDFPKVTLDAEETQIVSKLPQVEKIDALILARGCRDWSAKIGEDTLVTNLSQFSQVQLNLFKSFLGTKMKGEYPTIPPTLKSLYEYELKHLIGPNGILSTKIGPEERLKLVRYFAILSQEFAKMAGA